MVDIRRPFARREFLLTQLGWTLPGTLFESSRGMAASSALVAIVAPSSQLRDISMGTLERVFLGKPIADGFGGRFVPFNHPPRTKTRVLFDQRVLGMDPDEVARYWVDQRIRGKGRPPRSVASVSLLKAVVGRFPGAISYISVANLDSSVRALTVGGIRHDAGNYPIK